MTWHVLNPSFEPYRISPGPQQRRTTRRNVDNMAADDRDTEFPPAHINVGLLAVKWTTWLLSSC
jgi:hypothetical protein